MCDNSLITDQVQARLDKATQQVDVALESVRAMRQAILAQMVDSSADLRDIKVTPDEIAKAIETIRKHNADTERDIYLTDDEYMDLMTYKRQVEAIERVRELHKPVTESNAACAEPDCCGEYEEWEMCSDCQCDYPCPTIKALDGESE